MTGVELVFFLVGAVISMSMLIFGWFILIAYCRRQRDRTHASLFARTTIIARLALGDWTCECFEAAVNSEIDQILNHGRGAPG